MSLAALRVLTAGLLISGCAALKIERGDPIGVKLAKGVARVPVAVLSFGLSEAYYATERKMKSWLHQHESTLIMAWGPPTRIFPDGLGGKFIAYTENRVYVSPGYSTTTTTGSAVR